MYQYRKPLTKFQKSVYKAVLKVPAGMVTTYNEIAKYIGCNSAIAVGQALKRNPFAPIVPCHRVISSEKKIGGFNGKTSGQEIQNKYTLLSKEGVNFLDSTIENSAKIFTF